MCQSIELRKADGSFDRLIEKVRDLSALVGRDNLLCYAADDESVEPYPTEDLGDGNYCLCPFALEETLKRAGYDVEEDFGFGVIATPTQGGR